MKYVYVVEGVPYGAADNAWKAVSMHDGKHQANYELERHRFRFKKIRVVKDPIYMAKMKLGVT